MQEPHVVDGVGAGHCVVKVGGGIVYIRHQWERRKTACLYYMSYCMMANISTYVLLYTVMDNRKSCVRRWLLIDCGCDSETLEH